MKIIIRYLGTITHEVNLDTEKPEYIIGRAQDCDIRLTKDFISRKHGKIFYQEGQWYYQDLRQDHPHYNETPQEINHNEFIQIEQEIELVSDQYLNNSNTKIIDLNQIQNKKFANSHFIVASIILVALLIGGGFFVQQKLIPMNSQKLLSFSQQRFIEFQLKKDRDLEKDLIANNQFKKSDFKDNVGFCSGFIIAPKTVMTASHCLLGGSGVKPTRDYELKTFDGKKHQIDEVLGLDISRDIIVVKVNSLSDYPFFEFKSNHKIGEPVYTVGNVHGEGIAIRDGTISSVTKDPNNPKIEFIRYTAATSPGNSGGPLIDEDGRVVGLVFARSNAAENYNLSAPYYTLSSFVSAMRKSIEDSSNGYNVEVDTEKLIFGSHLTGEYYSAHLLPPAILGHQYFQKREVSDKLNRVKFSLKLPLSFDQFQNEIESKSILAMNNNIEEILEQIKKKKKVGIDWLSQVTSKHPVLIPRDLNDSLLTLDQLTSDFVWEKNILILEPGSYAEASASDQTYIANFLDNQFPKNYDLSKRSQFPQYLRTPIEPFSSIFAQETSLVLLDYTADEAQKFDEKKYQKSLQFEGAFNLNSFEVPYPFIRPKKRKNLKIKELNFESIGVVKDRFQRSWNVSKATVLRDLNLYRHCLNYPQAQMCFNIVFNAKSEKIREMQRQNYVKNFLSQRILDLNFWSVESLKTYLADSPSFEFQDLEMSSLDKIRYKYFQLDYNLSKTAKMIKILPAVIKTPNGDSQWVTIGHQTYHPKSQNSAALICRSEIDFPELKTSYLAEVYHKRKLHKKGIDQSREKQNERKVATLNGAEKIKMRTFKSSKWNKELKVYQACREIFKVEYDEGYHMGEFLNPPNDVF
ncbi:MAG: hypothetical protein CME65_00195 [Halobacteriovoraceae bacterium]|nr:hypothetical protein [Halobacteriovoraceae bacterium]|tara:strand:+ start:1010 stop:3586 length:2577 start_codon:yes stop_codon:yes gene_type:complete